MLCNSLALPRSLQFNNMIFKQILFSSAVIAALALSSCSEETQNNTSTAQDAETDAMLINTSTAVPGASSAQAATVISPTATSQAATQGSTQAAKTVAALNPPHGQPGHDCSVEVGAPLNKPGTAKTSSAAPQVQSATSAPATGSGRVNPPHGQPGHDCAVAVGAPLP